MTEVKLVNPKIWLDINRCQSIYERFKNRQKKTGKEPLPEFKTRYPGKLESILEAVKFKSSTLDQDIAETAVGYFTHTVKSQALLNGNKRMSIIFTHTFLYLNGYKLDMPWQVILRIALLLSEDKSTPIDTVKKHLIPIFRDSLTPVK